MGSATESPEQAEGVQRLNGEHDLEYNQIKKELEKYFSRDQRREVYSFLGRGFCIQGKIAIAKIFLNTAKQNKYFKDVLLYCEQEYHRNWKLQRLSAKGDPDNPATGPQNKFSLENIYEKLGIIMPE